MKKSNHLILTLAALLYLAGSGCSAGGSAEGTDPGNTPPVDPTDPGSVSPVAGAKVRSFFPETLLAEPFIETNAAGLASLDVPLADSITTWRGTVVANSLDGKYGASTFGIRVFQPFFVDLNLPVEVTRGDVLEVPIVVYNFDDGALTVQLDLAAEEGLAILGGASLGVEVEAGQVKAVKVPVEAEKVGEFMLTVGAVSAGIADAVRRPLRVVPDGERVEIVSSGVLKTVNLVAVDVPPNIVEGSAKLLVKLYPGKAALNSAGAEDLLQHPTGCFEQTTSSSWPNAMALAMLESDPGADPAIVEEARELVNEGYQRILTFQGEDGGFSWWGTGDAPGLAVTALGLMQLVDTAQVHPVDESVIQRAAQWLAGRQGADGSYESDTHLHSGNMSIGESDLRMTAYIAWALAGAGMQPEAVAGAVRYLKASADEINDAYTLSITVMALDASGLEPELKTTLAERLAAVQAEDGSIVSDNPTMYYSYGDQGTAENTAVGGLAFLSGGSFMPADNAAAWVAEHRMGSWGYGSTQTTVQSLRLLSSITLAPAVEEDISVSVSYDGTLFASETITASSADVMRQFDLSNLVSTGGHGVEIDSPIEVNIHYEVILIYHLPWEASTGPDPSLRLDVAYDRTALAVGELVTVTARLSSDQDDNMPMAELGVPPGFTLDGDLLDQARQDGLITGYEMKQGKLAVYFREIFRDQPITVTFRLKAGMAVEAQVPSSVAYPYYNPALRFETSSFPITVTE